MRTWPNPLSTVLFADSYDFDTEVDDRRLFVRPQRTEIGRMDVVKQRLGKAGFQVYEPQDSDESDDENWHMKDGREHPSDQVRSACRIMPKHFAISHLTPLVVPAEHVNTLRPSAHPRH